MITLLAQSSAIGVLIFCVGLGLVFFLFQFIIIPQMRSLRETVSQLQAHLINELKDVRETNSKKIETIQNLVSQQVQPNLNKRIDDAFDRINLSIKGVHQGLGAFDSMVDGIENIKKFMGNGKNLGIWGEHQLASILENIIAKTNYEENKRLNPDTNESVEFALKLPTGSLGNEEFRWLPIDAKFPQLKFHELVHAREAGDKDRSAKAKKELISFVRSQAKSIKQKYIRPPVTTEFAVLFLPAESIYAEVISEAGLFEEILNECQVHITGPTTLAALLTSLQVGFRMWNWHQRSSEVWSILQATKKETHELHGLIQHALKRHEAIQNDYEAAQKKCRALVKILNDVENQAPPSDGSVLRVANA